MKALNDISKLAEEFSACQKTLMAFGDENRQHLILEMMQKGECRGVRVGEITEKTHLSRPAVSHQWRYKYMELKEALRNRHSVRSYTDQPVETVILKALQEEIDACNKEGDLHIQLITDEPKAFDCFMARYGKFSGVKNYIALVGRKSADLDEKCGYYGERLALKAQQLGLNTCWVAMSYKKISGAFEVKSGEKLTVVIALGYGKTQGVAHKSKSPSSVSNLNEASPQWFKDGVEAALLAPTAMNQQKFSLTYADGKVSAKSGTGFYTKLDLGIVKYNFEIGAGKENFNWD